MKRQKPLTGSVQSNGAWLYAVINTYVRGKRKQVWVNSWIPVTGSRRNAETFLREELARREIERSKPQNIKDASKDMPFVDYMRLWLTTKKRKIEEITYQGYSALIEKYIKEYFTSIDARLSTLEPNDIEEFYDFLYDKDLSGTTALRHHRIMKQALDYAVKKDILLYNIMSKVDAPQKNAFVAASYSADELKELLEQAKGDVIFVPIVLAATLGMRRSEVLGIKWRSVDFSAGTLTVEHKVLEVQGEHGLVVKGYDRLKTKSSRRTLPLPKLALEVLQVEKQRQADNRKAFKKAYCKERHDYVCVDAMGYHLRPTYVTAHFSWLLKKCGLRHIRYHELRHTAASLLASNGVPIKNIQLFLGHSNYSTTADIYTHLDHRAQEQSIGMMNKILE